MKPARVKCERIDLRQRGREREREREKGRESRIKCNRLFRHEHAVGFRINDLLKNVVYYYEL